jgi:Xaa-Pro aminopeptidase
MIPKNRREKLLSQLDDGALVIISTNPQQYRNGDTHYPDSESTSALSL